MTAPAQDLDHRHAGEGGRLHSRARMRRCIVSGDVLPEARLLRFAADPEGRVIVDAGAELPGRGMWLRSERESIARAAAKQSFARAAKAPLRAGADLADQAEAQLARRLLDGLGLACRAGQMQFGFDAVEKSLRGVAPAAVIIEASDGSEEGAGKLRAAAQSGGVVPFVIGCFTGAELSLALGRANVIHAAVKPGRLAERLIFDAGRLSGFRTLEAWKWAGFSPRSALAGAAPDVLSLVERLE